MYIDGGVIEKISLHSHQIFILTAGIPGYTLCTLDGDERNRTTISGNYVGELLSGLSSHSTFPGQQMPACMLLNWKTPTSESARRRREGIYWKGWLWSATGIHCTNITTAGIDKSESQWEILVQHSNEIQISLGSLVKYDASGLIRTNPGPSQSVSRYIFAEQGKWHKRRRRSLGDCEIIRSLDKWIETISLPFDSVLLRYRQWEIFMSSSCNNNRRAARINVSLSEICPSLVCCWQRQIHSGGITLDTWIRWVCGGRRLDIFLLSIKRNLFVPHLWQGGQRQLIRGQ